METYRRRGVQRFAFALLALFAVLAATACAPGAQASVSTPTPTTPAVPTATPAPKLLYQADWSHGANGWTLPPHWHIKNGQLVNDGGGHEPINIPYAVTVPNYALEVELQVQGIPTNVSGCPGYFGFVGQDSAGKQLFSGDANCLVANPALHAWAELGTTNVYPGGFIASDYVVGYSTKVYRIEVHGRAIKYASGTYSVGSLVAPYALSPVQLSIVNTEVQMVISRVSIWQI